MISFVLAVKAARLFYKVCEMCNKLLLWVFIAVCSTIGAESFESHRLPNTTIPFHYDLLINTDVHNSNLDYNGTVKIYINVVEDTKQIVLHSSRSTLVDLVLRNDNQLPISVINYEYEIEKEFLIVNTASDLKNGSMVILEIDFVNSINRTDQAGFYRTSYNNSEGVLKYAGVTQFQPCDARSAFPCYDEPGIKATFDVRISCGVEYHARSNGDIASVKLLSADKKLVTFQRTPAMQTYLLAFLVSDFAVKRDFANSTKKITVQSMARPTHADQLQYTLDASVKLIDELQTYFDHPYELNKMDSVAIRNIDFSAGAMENWGLVTYLESLLLISDSSTTNQKRSAVTVIAHEFAHQFFGNLMAPKWWSYLWLNEGFATLYEYYLSDRTHPELLIKERFPGSALQLALQVDGSTTVRPMTYYVETVPEIERLFDRISYEKSGCVLRMMHYALGEKVFLKGLKYYIKKHQNSVVVPQNLFDSLQRAALEAGVLPPNSSMTHILESWSNQPGVPVVTVNRTSGTDKFTFAQQRFFSTNQSKENNQTWWIPIFVYTNSSGGDHEKTPLFWIPQGVKELTHTIATQPEDVLIVNPAQTGYYRVNYDTQTWTKLVKVLHKLPVKLDPITRAQLIDDSMNLAHAGLLDHTTAFQVLDHLRNSIDYHPWKSAYRNILELEKLLSTDPASLELLHQYLLILTEKLYETYVLSGEGRNETANDESTLLIAIDLGCRSGQPDCMEYAIAKMNFLQKQRIHLLRIRSETEQRWYCSALRDGRRSMVDKFKEALEMENDSQGRLYLMESLACVGNRLELKRILEFLGEGIASNRELIRFMEAAAEYSGGGQAAVMDFMEKEMERLDGLFGSRRSVEKFLIRFADRIVDRLNADRLLQMMKIMQVSPDLERIITAKIEEQILWQQKNAPLVLETLQNYLL